MSGSATDNLDPGTYAVYSRSRYAVGLDDSGTMEYFVRFTEGDAGGAIGFHTIPVDDGEPVQTAAELGGNCVAFQLDVPGMGKIPQVRDFLDNVWPALTPEGLVVALLHDGPPPGKSVLAHFITPVTQLHLGSTTVDGPAVGVAGWGGVG